MSVEVVRFVVAGQEALHQRAAFTGRPYVVVYDGHCKVCTRLAGKLAAWDSGGVFDVVASQAGGVQARFPWIPPQAYRESLQVVGPGGRTWQGAAAVEEILDRLPRGRLLTWIFSLPFARAVAERAYRAFARNRYRLGCGAHCEYRPPNLDFQEKG